MTQITLLYTGDIHAHVEQFLRAAYVAQLQRYELTAVGHHTILVDSGDAEDRTLVESDLSKGAAMYRLLKAANYDAAAIGNSTALTYGPQALASIAETSGLPLLCANLQARGPEPEPLEGLQPTLIVACGPVRVGLIGLTLSIGPALERLYPVTQPDIQEVVQTYTSSLRAQGCQVIGVVSHIGYDVDIELARANPDLSFIIGGHSHTLPSYPTDVGGIPVCHAGDHARYLGRLDLVVDGRGHTLKWHGRLIQIAPDGPRHPAAAQTWRLIQHQTQLVLTVPAGNLTSSVDLATDRPCGMAQLLVDALRVRMGADIGLCISGHLETGLSEGPVTMGSLARACRSPGNASAAVLTGAQIIRALEYGADPAVWQQTPRALRGKQIGILQVSGLNYTLDLGAAAGQRVSDVRYLGQPLDSNSSYRVAATDFELNPERGYFPDLALDQVEYDIPWVLREVLQAHFQAFDPLTPGTHPRITLKSQQEHLFAPTRPLTSDQLTPDNNQPDIVRAPPDATRENDKTGAASSAPPDAARSDDQPHAPSAPPDAVQNGDATEY